jgi:hypothetical protein
VESDVSNEEVGEESELDAVNTYLAVGPCRTQDFTPYRS